MSESVPAGWEIKKLGDFCSIQSTRAKEKLYTPFSVSKVLGIIPQSEKFKKRVASKDISNYKIIEPLDFAYDPMLLWDGSINRNNRDQIGVVSPAYTVFKVDEKQTNSDYYLFFLKSSLTINFYKNISKGTNVRRQKAEFKEFCKGTFCFPPLPEQQKIASILTSVDTVIEKTEVQINKLKDLKKAMMQELLTKGIGHTEFKDSPVGRIPRSWQLNYCNDACSKIFVGIASSTTHAYTDHKGVIILRNQNIKEGRIDTEDILFITHEFSEANASKKLKQGDVITARTGYPGISAVVSKRFHGMHSFTTLISRPKGNLITSDYYALFFNSDIGQNTVNKMQAGGAQQNLNVEVMKRIVIPVPTIKEQREIVSIISSIGNNIEEIQNKLSHIKSLKKALMQDLLTGKVRVKV
jgi:type I restriction enzyme, S subunit